MMADVRSVEEGSLKIKAVVDQDNKLETVELTIGGEYLDTADNKHEIRIMADLNLA